MHKSISNTIALIISYIGASSLILLPLIYYSSLPDIIPTHFAIDGTPDAFGPKSNLLFLCGIGLVVWLFIKWVKYNPQLTNFPVVLTAENTQDVHKLMEEMTLKLNALIVLIIAYIALGIILISKGTIEKLHAVVLWTFFGLIILHVGYNWIKARRLQP